MTTLTARSDRTASQSNHARHVWLGSGLAALALLAPTIALADPLPASAATILPALLVTAGVAICERWVSIRVRLGRQSHSLTLSELPLVAGLYMLSPLGLVVARAVGVVVGKQLLSRQAAHKTAFNVVVSWVESLAAVGVLALIATTGLDPSLALLLTGLLVGLVTSATGTAAMVAASRLRTRDLPLADARRMLLAGVAPTAITGVLGSMLVALWQAAPVLIVAPIGIAMMLLVAYRSYLGLLQANHTQRELLGFTQAVGAPADCGSATRMIVAEARKLLAAHDVCLQLRDGRWVGAPEGLLADLERDARRMPPEGGISYRGGLDVLWTAMGEGWLVVIVEPRTLTDLDMSTVRMVAGHAAVVLDSAFRGESLRRKAAEANQLARQDALTGLPNRVALVEALEDATRNDDAFGVLLLDLDDFKQVNDALGHEAGDRVLTEITRRVQPMAEELVTFARLGGDEFAAIVEGDPDTCLSLADRLHTQIGHEVEIDDYHVAVGSSIGVSLFPAHGRDGATLLKHAGLAMYDAKRRGGRTEVYGVASGGRAMRELEISSGFRAALDSGDVDVLFQPIIDLHTGELTAVEALTRWTHPRLGPITPEEFVAAAEQHGMVTELTRLVLDTSLRWQRLWAACGLDLQIAVNISATSLTDPNLPGLVAGALARRHVDASRLTLELTESSIVTDPTTTLATLRQLSLLGVRLAVDDFGTGYSSLAYLRELPVDEVKIDKSFVQPLDNDERVPSLLSGIINLCRQLGFELVGEGIETQTVQARLTDMGCTRGQGFHIAHPMDGTSVLQWEAEWSTSRTLDLT